MQKKNLYRITFLLIFIGLFFSVPHQVFAEELLLRSQLPIKTDLYFTNVAQIPDPIVDTKTIYGYLSTSYAADSYYFIPSKEATISVEVLVPVRTSNEVFKPGWEIVGENILPQPMNIYFSVPPGSDYIGHDYYVPVGPRPIVTDPVTYERLYSGNRQSLKVLKGKLYYINVYDPFHYMGEYVLKIGNSSGDSPLAHSDYIRNLITVKTNQVGRQIDGLELWGVFLCLLGFVIGFGPLLSRVFVFLISRKLEKKRIELDLFCKQQSLLLFGAVIYTFGQIYLYRNSLFSGIALGQLFVYEAIILFYIVLRFFLKKYIGTQTAVSLLRLIIITFLLLLFCLFISIEMFLFVWYLFMMR